MGKKVVKVLIRTFTPGSWNRKTFQSRNLLTLSKSKSTAKEITSWWLDSLTLPKPEARKESISLETPECPGEICSLSQSRNSRLFPMGFTLVEVFIVVLIVGIVITLALPRMGGTYSRLKCEREIGKITALVEYLYNQAQIKDQEYSLIINLDAGKFWVITGDEEVDSSEQDEATVQERKIASFLHIQDISLSGCRVSHGQVAIQFRPAGYVDAATLHFASDKQVKYTLFLNPLTGKTKLEKGYLQEEPI